MGRRGRDQVYPPNLNRGLQTFLPDAVRAAFTSGQPLSSPVSGQLTKKKKKIPRVDYMALS